MSFAALTWAAGVDGLSPTARAVLVVLADAHNWKTGKCFPSHARISKKSRTSESTVRRVVRELEGLGLISRRIRVDDRGGTRGVSYTLHFGKGSAPQPHSEVITDAQGSDHQQSEGEINAAQGSDHQQSEGEINAAQGSDHQQSEGATNNDQGGGHQRSLPIRTNHEPNREGEPRTQSSAPLQIGRVAGESEPQSPTTSAAPAVTVGAGSRKARSQTSAADRGTLLSPDWQPDSALRAFGRERGFDDRAFREVVGAFRDYWLAASGSKARKRDWDAAFRYWLRTDAKQRRERPKTHADFIRDAQRDPFGSSIAEHFAGPTIEGEPLAGFPSSRHRQ